MNHESSPRPNVVVALDFPGRRDEARLADLDLESAGIAVRYLLAERLPSTPIGAAYVDELADQLDQSSPVIGVLGYCAAAPMARELARRYQAKGVKPAVVVFNGSLGSAQSVRDAYVSSLRQLRATAADLAAVSVPEQALRDDPAGVVRAMEETLRRLAMSGLALEDDDESDLEDLAAVAEELVVRHLSFLTHLVASASLSADVPPEGLHVVSRDHDKRSGWVSGDTIRIESSRTDFVGCPETRQVVLQRFDRHTGPSRGADQELRGIGE